MAAPDSITWDFDQASQMGAKTSSSIISSNVREILRDPNRLRAIQHVALRGVPQIKHLEPSFFTNNLAPQETETLKTWISEVQVPTSQDQSEHDSQSPTLAVLAILSRLSNLKTLEVETFDRTADDEEAQARPPGDPFMACLLRHLTSSSPPGNMGRMLDTARILVPRPEDDPEDEMDYYVYPSSLLPLFNLPRIQRIEAHRVDDGGKPVPGVTTCQTLRELRLVRCQLTEESLSLMLGAAPNLTMLHCDLVLDAEYTSGWFELSRVRASLGGLRDSLEDLSLALNLWSSTAIDCGNEGPWGICGSLGSLKGFGCLERLSVSLPVLLGWRVQGSSSLADVLPAGLRSLTITNEMFFWWHYEWDVVDWDKKDARDTPRWRWIEEKIVEYLGSRPGSLEELVLDIPTAGEAERAGQLRDTLVSKGQDLAIKVTWVRQI